MHSADSNMCALKNTKKMRPFNVKSITLHDNVSKHRYLGEPHHIAARLHIIFSLAQRRSLNTTYYIIAI